MGRQQRVSALRSVLSCANAGEAAIRSTNNQQQRAIGIRSSGLVIVASAGLAKNPDRSS
jgi:hypothetical protein